MSNEKLHQAVCLNLGVCWYFITFANFHIFDFAYTFLLLNMHFYFAVLGISKMNLFAKIMNGFMAWSLYLIFFFLWIMHLSFILNFYKFWYFIITGMEIPISKNWQKESCDKMKETRLTMTNHNQDKSSWLKKRELKYMTSLMFLIPFSHLTHYSWL